MHAPQRDPTTVAFESGVSLFGDIRRYRLANLFPRLIRAPPTPHLHPLSSEVVEGVELEGVFPRVPISIGVFVKNTDISSESNRLNNRFASSSVIAKRISVG